MPHLKLCMGVFLLVLYLGQKPPLCLKQQMKTATAGQCCAIMIVTIITLSFDSFFLMRKVEIALLSRKHLNQEDSHQLNGTANASYGLCVHCSC